MSHLRKLTPTALAVLVVLACLGGGPVGAQTVQSPVPSAIVQEYGLDTTFYKKYVDAWGIPVLGSANVGNAALQKAHAQLGTLLWTYPYWPVPELDQRKVRVVIMARTEDATDIPEFRAAFGTSPSYDTQYWGGFGATDYLPVSAGTEDNLIDGYGNENVFAHEFGHTIADMALRHIDPNFTSELTSAYNDARSTGKWINTYADDNVSEYWAEGVQSYFGVNRQGPVGGDGVHNHVDTRAELASYDPRLYALLHRVYQGRTLPN